MSERSKHNNNSNEVKHDPGAYGGERTNLFMKIAESLHVININFLIVATRDIVRQQWNLSCPRLMLDK